MLKVNPPVDSVWLREDVDGIDSDGVLLLLVALGCVLSAECLVGVATKEVGNDWGGSSQ